MSVFEIILIIIGVCLVIYSLIVNVKGGFLSKMIFKIFPFFAGLFCIAYAFMVSGFIKIG